MPSIYEEIIKLDSSGESFIVVTVVEKKGSGPASPGTKMLVMANGSISGTVGGGSLEYTAVQECRNIFENKKSILKSYMLDSNENVSEESISLNMSCGGKVSLFYEYNKGKHTVVIIGAGHIGQALAYHLKPLSYSVLVADKRQEYTDRVEQTDTHLITDYKTFFEPFKTSKNTLFVIATHSHDEDYIALKNLVEAEIDPPYIGIVASKRKTKEMLKQLKEETTCQWSSKNIYAPVGLKTGGTLPHDIAISIISELQTIKHCIDNHLHMRIP